MSKRLKLDVLKSTVRTTRQGNKAPILNSENSPDTEKSRFFEATSDENGKAGAAPPRKEPSTKAKATKKGGTKSKTKKVPDENDQVPNDSEVEDGSNESGKHNGKVSSNWFPKNWQEQLDNIKQMRQNNTAPVDEMGCHKCADKTASGPIFRYQSLLALMLSSQTKDEITYAAMQRLKEVNCTPQSIVALPDEQLGKLIYPASFWKRKVQYLKRTSEILLQKYNGDIPNNVKELCELPGVGPKMAHICMQVAWKEVSGIGVDTHVHRISNRLKWVPKPTKTPEETRVALESWLPKEQWTEINYLFVGFGQEICQALRPKCSECSNRKICPFTGNKYQF